MELVDSKTLQRRLNKSIKLAEKLRQKNLYETEANKELAKRNHFLRRSILVEQKRVDKVKALVNSLESLVKSQDAVPKEDDLILLVNDLKEALNENELVVPAIEEPQTKANRISTRRQSSLFVHLPELSGTSLVRKSAEFVKTSNELNELVEGDSSGACAQNKFPDFNICTPLFEHFLVIGASPEAATEFANLIQAAEDDSLSNRFMRTLGGFLAHPRFMKSSNTTTQTGLKTPSSVGATPSNNSGSGATSVTSATPVKSRDELTNDIDLERRESSMSMSAADLKPENEPVVPTSATKSIFSYFSRSTTTAASNNNTQHQQPVHHHNAAAAELLKAIGDSEIDVKSKSVDEADSAIVSVESASDLKLDLDSEVADGWQKSPMKEDPNNEPSPNTHSQEESPSKSSLISGTTSALNRFGGFLNKLSVASDKTATAVVSSALKGGKSNPNLSRNRSSSAAEIANESDVVIGTAIVKPIVASTSETALNESNDVATVASTSDISGIGSPYESNTLNFPAQIVSNGASVVPTKPVSLLSHSDKKAGIATTEGSILYRYPPTVEPPPPEISEFCLPLGGKLRRLFHKDEDTMVQEILFGHSQSKRSGRCFIFLLEDKTTMGDNINDDEAGIGTGRLYGICVTHPRLLKTNVVVNNHKQSAPSSVPRMDESSGEEKDNYEFESSVCYAFITRFPLFDFFFQLIFDMITLERLVRMEMAVDQSDADMKYSRNVYEYLPQTILNNCLERLTRLSPPRYNERMFFSISKSIQSVEFYRSTPKEDFPEHYANAADWALPTLLSWLPIETVVWSLSLLMSEAKLIVVGYESGMVSCAVMGLLVLLRPLEWVAPLIPMLPLKLLDFIESPVPILAGLTLDPTDKGMEVNKLLDRCSDPNDGTILAVLDVNKRDLFISGGQRGLLKSLGMPNSDLLAENLKSCLKKDFDEARGRGRPLYAVSGTQKTVSRHAHDVITSHIQGVIALAKDYVPRDTSVHSQGNLISAVSDGFSSCSESDDEEEEDSKAVQSSLLEYYANIVNDGEKPGNSDVASTNKHDSSTAILHSKAASQAVRYKRSTSISSQGSTSLVNAASNTASASHEPVKLNAESLRNVDQDGFLVRFRSTQLFSEHVGSATAEDNPAAPDLINVDNVNVAPESQENDIVGATPPNNRLSISGNTGVNRRQSMNLMFTQDHKLRLLNENTLLQNESP